MSKLKYTNVSCRHVVRLCCRIHDLWTYNTRQWCTMCKLWPKFSMKLVSHNVLLHNTHTRLTAIRPGLPGWDGTRKVKPIWILLKQDTVSGSSISWAICKSALRSRQIATPAPHHSVFYRLDDLPATQPTASKHCYTILASEIWLWGVRHPLHQRFFNKCITHTHTRLTALFLGLAGWAGTRKVNQSGFYWSKRQWVAVASAGPYASLHLAPDR